MRDCFRAGLWALPGMSSLLVVDALRAGPRVLRARAEILEQLGRVIQEDGSRPRGARELLPLTGEGVVGAVFSVIHTRLQSSRSGSLVGLLNQLMAIVVLPYQGPVAARPSTSVRGGPRVSPTRGVPLPVVGRYGRR